MALYKKRFQEVSLESLYESKKEGNRSQSSDKKGHGRFTPQKSVVPLLDLSSIHVGLDPALDHNKKLSLKQILLQHTGSTEKSLT